MRRTIFFLIPAVVLLIISATFSQTCIAARTRNTQSDSTVTPSASDKQAPSIPQGLMVSNKTCTTIALSWTASSDNVRVKGYEVYRDGRKIATTAKVSYTNNDLVPGRKYTYFIKAYDAAGNISGPCPAVSATTTGDTQAPSVPGTLTAVSSSYTSITLNWLPSTDNTGIKGYEIYCNGRKTASTSSTYYICKRLDPGKSYTFTAKAYDIAGNYSIQSNSISAGTVPDTAAPSTPEGLKASSVSETAVSLTWSPSTDNVKVKGYEVFCDGEKIGTTSKTYFDSKKLVPGKSYSYTVKAFDASGNISGNSICQKVSTVKDIYSPSAPTGLKTSSVTKSSVTLKWTASTDNVKVKGYYIYCNGIKIADTTRTSYTARGLGSLSLCIFWVRAYDFGGNLSENSSAVTVMLL